MASIKNIFTKEESDQIVASIEKAELNSSAEVRVHIETRCKGDVIKRASQVFTSLRMHKTAQRNGVLIYIAVEDHKLAIIGDKGINDVVEDGFWNTVYQSMKILFKENKMIDGISTACEMVGEKLKIFFPYTQDDENELPNTISFGNE